MHRTTKGRFTYKHWLKRNLRFTGEITKETIAGCVMVAIVLAITVDMNRTEEVITIVNKAQAEEPQEVRIKVVTDWNHDRILAEINTVFPNEPIMKKIVWCESRYKIDAFNPTNGSNDEGLFQISELYHGEEYRALGLDMNDPADNIRFARILYDRNGLQDWIWSKPCWSK